jgi:Flp pilus assembly protein TadG
MIAQARSGAPCRPQSGATIVEFAFVAALFFSLLLGIMDFGRILFAWNSAAEATRLGARIAVVCDKLTPSQVRDRMKKISPNLTDANIVINYYDPPGIVNNACTKATCKAVEVSLTGVAFNPVSPFLLFNVIGAHDFRTYLLRESMEAINAAGDQNPVCFL